MAQRGVYALRLTQTEGSMRWTSMSACTPARLREQHPGVKPSFFYEDAGRGAITVQARMNTLSAIEVCNSCPVRPACLQHALAVDEYGVWGGTTRKQRKRLAAKQRRIIS